MARPKLRLITKDRQSNFNCQSLAMEVGVPDGRYVGPGALITTQSAANSLPLVSARKHSNRQHLQNLRLVSN